MKSFLDFLSSHPKIKLNWILALLSLSLIPAVNYYYSLDLNSYHPLIRAVEFQFEPLAEYPVNVTQRPKPQLSAQSALVVDVTSKAILFTKNPDLKLLPASTTKVMTALVALDQYQLNEIVTVNGFDVIGQKMELESEERITVENLLYGLLVASGNDAALALAQYYSGGEEAFINAMNQKSINLGLKDTHFANVTGLDDPDHFTTVHDLSLLAAEAMTNDEFVKFVSTQSITVSDIDQTIVHELETINELLGKIEGLSGVKTGWTELAGECLVTFTEREGRKIITVVLNSADRFGESQTLIDWTYQNFSWQSVPEAKVFNP